MGNDDAERKARALERKARITARVTTMDDDSDFLPPIFGLEAMSLAARITRDSWTLAGLPWPEYDRKDIPVRLLVGSKD